MENELKEEQIEKMQGFAKIGKVITFIMFVLGLIFLALLIGGLIYFNSNKFPINNLKVEGNSEFNLIIETTNEEGRKLFKDFKITNEKIKNSLMKITMDVDGVKEDGDDRIAKVKSAFDGRLDKKDINTMMSLPIIEILLLTINIFLLHRLFKNLSTRRTPFNMETVKDAKAFGYSLIPWILIGHLMGLVGAKVTNEFTPFNITIDLRTVVVVVFVLLIVKIFEYGVNLLLEKNIDEE